MTSEAMRNGNEHYFENLLFSKRAPRVRGQVIVIPFTFLQACVPFLHWSTDSSEFVFCDKPMFFERQSDSCVNGTHPCLLFIHVWMTQLHGFFTMFLVTVFSFWNFQLYPPPPDAKKWGYKIFSARSARRMYPHFQKRDVALANDTCLRASPQRGRVDIMSTSLIPEVVPEISANSEHKKD